MLKIRLKRLGRKKQPHYRIIVCNSTTRRETSPVEEIGYYEPKQKVLRMDKAKALDWVKKGACPTETVKRLIECSTDEGTLSADIIEYRMNRKAKLKELKESKKQAETATE